MRRVHRRGLFTLPTAGLAMVLATGVAAQKHGDDQARSYPDLDRMHDEAMTLAYSSVEGDLEKATWRHGNVAYSRPTDDARRFECLRIQAELLHATGYIEGSKLFLEEAARQADATGDPYNAAMTYVDAALVAKEAGDRWAARVFASRARALVSSPALDIDQRASILDRVTPGWRH